jgi:hypothetical protein
MKWIAFLVFALGLVVACPTKAAKFSILDAMTAVDHAIDLP